ncbi:polysaccharide deacetylase family protein [Chlorogloeopsis fritschii PCC 9212]|jgi:peptidoglycan/xylan/chitin deacetylase (PgdA/CDA1 family)|uniref:Chitooligosaccharide deacetylase NodB-like protein n=1 Tax=Chlorogloeopsis fritschii PCC 6912 TaxID=211165 RepID=A0A3S0ZCA8_CHLFR|nr:polysaccharide deacetylase family protein [Chlorogloeopsis fritschii]RUR73378.1 chitooligosaccharide deacetylase NodB-like protein [Chlorogloeopsis fritschii PCC 6912]
MQFYPLFPVLHPILKPSFPNCLWEGDRNSKFIALSFDDGPHPQYTPQLLKVLDRYNITANFFWLGACVNRSPEIAKDICDRGHWIGLHGYDHRNFPMLAPNELKQSLEKTQVAIYQACNLQPQQVRDVRPPNGLFTPKTLNFLQQWDYRTVMWSVVPEDWVRPGVANVVQRVLKDIKNGSIVVLHDGICGGEDVAEITQVLIPLLLQRGYQFVTIDTLWQQIKGTNGHGEGETRGIVNH